MTKKVLFSTNDDSEMMEIIIDGKTVFYGNYWDFSVRDIPSLLEKCGVYCEEYHLPDEDEYEEEWEWEDE